jgi:mono/diheme cytochrome c family protein
MKPQVALFAAAAVALAMSDAHALSPAAQRGQTFAKANCSMCHAIGKTGDSPLALAPPFRTIHDRYPVEDLEESLAEGIVTGHPTMPQFQLDAAQVNDFIAYLKSLEE